MHKAYSSDKQGFPVHFFYAPKSDVAPFRAPLKINIFEQFKSKEPRWFYTVQKY